MTAEVGPLFVTEMATGSHQVMLERVFPGFRVVRAP